MGKKKSIQKGLESLAFKTFLASLTIPKIKEIITKYNQEADSKDKKLKGYSGLKKDELVNFINSHLDNSDKSRLYKDLEKNFAEGLLLNAISLISGEHKVERIQSAVVIAGGSGYNVWFSSKYGSHKASLQVIDNTVDRTCNCAIGKNNGLCLHQMAIYLMLIGKKIISSNNLPFNVEKKFFDSIQKRLELTATQSLFKEDPAIMLEGDYKIYINDKFITLEWGGEYAGKTTKDLANEDVGVETWVTKKVVDLVSKVMRTGATGKPPKILIDNYNVISKILDNSKHWEKILKKFADLNDPDLPKDEKELENYLKNNLKETTAEMSVEPPFSAYMGNESFIFVSYTHKDKADVYPILQKLHHKGFKIWYDEGIPLSTDWCNTIAEKLMQSSLFLSFISPYVMESDNTQDEIHLAMNEKKPYLAIYLKDTELNPGLKMRIRRVQGILKHEMEEDQFYNKLIDDLNNLLK
ncbi:MAG: toll/interleukin-1 receptor domain-containing protein [Candidatus Hermodarchaeota archaeon]